MVGASCFNTYQLFPQGPHFQEIVLDGRSYSTTSKRPGAPRRALTCWDSISDLPPILSGHDQLSIPYQADPRSHLQRNFRKKATNLTDHITKPLNALQQERINLIPTDPGADWRDLPNKVELVAICQRAGNSKTG